VHPSFLLRQVAHDLRVNLLVVPGVVLAVHLAAGALLPSLEADHADAPVLAVLTRIAAVEPGTAQVLMTTVAGAIMTVVSVVYSVLLVALSLASIQFSTRILGHFMKDGLNRIVLGMFVGTFAYCLMVLRAVRTDPPWVPSVSVALGVLLALACLASLVLFIHRIATGIQANVLVDHIASEAEAVIDAVFPVRGAEAPPGPQTGGAAVHRAPVSGADGLASTTVRATRSGYVQLVDVKALLDAAGTGELRLLRHVGAFVAAGGPVAHAHGAYAPDLPARVADALDVGAMRTMQDDAEYGLRQIVDIALKALSPAVNDPSTACTCIDHLGRLLLRIAMREDPRQLFVNGQGGRVVVPNTSFRACVDLAFDQIRQYGASDMAVQLRMLRVLGELATVADRFGDRSHLRLHGQLVHAAASSRFSPVDREELDRRWADLQRACTADA
jgi:uncharacterized membrane protein